jgi:hypothetical protein
MENGRCRMHGGLSLAGHQHPRFKHGRYAKTTYEGKLRRREVEQRKRERARRKEDRYVYGKLNRWVDEQIARRGTYNFVTAMSLVRRWRREYQERLAAAKRKPEPVAPEAPALNPAVEGLRFAAAQYAKSHQPTSRA